MKSFGEWHGARSANSVNEMFGLGFEPRTPSISETMPWNKLKDFFDVQIKDLSKTIDPEKIEDLNRLHHDYEKLKSMLDDVVSKYYDLKADGVKGSGRKSSKEGFRVRARSASSMPSLFGI